MFTFLHKRSSISYFSVQWELCPCRVESFAWPPKTHHLWNHITQSRKTHYWSIYVIVAMQIMLLIWNILHINTLHCFVTVFCVWLLRCNTWQTLWRVIQVDDIKVDLSRVVFLQGAASHPHADLGQLFCFLYQQLKDGQRLWQNQSNVLTERQESYATVQIFLTFPSLLSLISHLELHELLQRFIPH